MIRVVLAGFVLVHSLGGVQLHARTVFSRSGQFVVSWPDRRSVPPLSSDENRNGVVILNSDLLLFSLERIKAGLLGVLNQEDRWRGKIRITVKPEGTADQPVVLQATRYSDGWNYRVMLPGKMKETRFVEEITGILLLEMANRMADQRSAELPLWLVKGAHGQMVATSLFDVSLSQRDIIQPGARVGGARSAVPSFLRRDPLTDVRTVLSENLPVSATDLFVPKPEGWNDTEREVYEKCAQLFLARLLERQAGSVKLHAFMQLLPKYWNWQNAFFEAFAPEFERLLDVEKWWAVTVSQLRNGGWSVAWSRSRSARQLDWILRPEALVGVDRRTLPTRTRFTLQEVLRNWNRANQQTVLRRIASRLAALRLQADVETAGLIADYLAVISEFERERSEAGYEPTGRGRTRTPIKRIVDRAARKLDRLDRKRYALVEDEPEA